MKPVYRCEYCDHMGTQDELMKHEEDCFWNYNRKSCRTCKHADPNSAQYKCLKGVEIPDGCIMERCSEYEWDEKDMTKKPSSIFGGLFGGL